MTFDNTKRMFDIDCDEVEMTRRLYRTDNTGYAFSEFDCGFIRKGLETY